jgi:hypothetical protein|tara:strand:- start:283 stop:564 length:282 start_codon:yes stop_codon:yes gene_type:complete
MNFRNLPRITLDQARALGFVIDYPEHPRGNGMPMRDDYGPTGEVYTFEWFTLDPRTPLAGWLCRCDGAHSSPAFVAGHTREDALQAVEQGGAR